MRRDLTGEIAKLIDRRTQYTKRDSKKTVLKRISINNELYFDPADQKLLAGKLKDASVTTAAIANLAVDVTKLANLSVEASKLANSSVTSTKIANLAVGSAAIAALAVGTGHIANLAVTEGQIGNLAVTNGKIAALAVNNAKISDLSATKLNAGYITTASWTGDDSDDYQLLYRQVHQFIENDLLVKLAIGFVDDNTGTKVPGIVLGAGNGDDTGVNKGFITKDANGLNMYYVSGINAAHGITIKSDGIYCSSELKLDTTLSQTYVTQSGWMSNLTQKLNSSGNFGVNQTGKRIEVTDKFVAKNSSGQNHGLYCDPTYSDLYLYYNGVEHVKFLNGLDGVTSFYIQGNKMGHGSSTIFYPQGAWDFTDVTVTGTKKIHVSATAPTDTNMVWIDTT